MIFFLGIIFLVLIIFLLDWLSTNNKKQLNKKINLIIIFISLGIGIILLIGGLYLYSPVFFSIAAWFLRKKIIFDLLLNFFRKKKKINQNDYKQKMSLRESYELLGIDEKIRWIQPNFSFEFVACFFAYEFSCNCGRSFI